MKVVTDDSIEKENTEIAKAEAMYRIHDIGSNYISRTEEINTAKRDGVDEVPIQIVLTNQTIKKAEEELKGTDNTFKAAVAELMMIEEPDIGYRSLKVRTEKEVEKILDSIHAIYGDADRGSEMSIGH